MSDPVMVKTKKSIEVSRSISMVIANDDGQPNRITADSTGSLPESIEVLRVGMWRTPYHGDIMIMPEDLDAYVNNFNDGVARADDGKMGLPINFAHESWEKAAGWMTELYVQGQSLMAKVEWTEAGKQGLTNGEWKCFSPEFCPAGRGGWVDPLDEEKYIDNVLEGGALTNIPLFRNMKPIMASASFGEDNSKPNVFFVTASEVKQGDKMDLSTIVAKKNEELTEAEKDFLAQPENKEKLTDEQKVAFGFEDAPSDDEDLENKDKKVEEDVSEVKVAPELAEVAASLKSGESIVIKASEYSGLKEKVSNLEKDKITEKVKAHVARGAIKADKLEAWADKIQKDPSMLDMLGDLPSNPVLADTQGSDTDAADATELEARLHEKVVASRNESVKSGDPIKPYSEVRASIIKSDDAFKSLRKED